MNMIEPTQNYQRQAILNASPAKLISILYDFGIQACYQKDEKKLQEVLDTLINSLNFEFEMANSLYEIYEYCQRQARKKEFDEVRNLIEGLRDTWNMVVVSTSKKNAPKVKFESKGFLV